MSNTYFKTDFLLDKDNNTLNKFIDNLFPQCLGIAKRYSKTDEQAEEICKQCFLNTLKEMIQKKETEEEFNDTMFLHQFKICLVKTLLSQRTGELIADTISISVAKSENNLFSTSEYYKNLSAEEIILHLRKLNLLQQIIYNLISIDNFSTTEVAEIVEHNELSVKALFEKAQYNLLSSIKSII